MNAKQNAIAAEYGEPFWEVVRGYADDGHSVYGTATLLEYSPPAFRRLVLRHGVSDWFARGQSSAWPDQRRLTAVVAAQMRSAQAQRWPVLPIRITDGSTIRATPTPWRAMRAG